MLSSKIFRWLCFALCSIAVLILIAAIACFKPLDKTSYRETGFYKKELKDIAAATVGGQPTSPANFECGWSKENLLPPFTTSIAIDAHRYGEHFKGVHDSIYTRAFVFKQGETKVAFISADLLIIPPTVTKILDTLLCEQGFSNSNIFFTATHTHSSLGGWYPSYVGEIFAGKYDERVPKFIATQMAKAILRAEQNLLPSEIGFTEISARHLVYNRLVTDMANLSENLGEVDSMIRVVKIKNSIGRTAALVTFSAHCTVFHESMMQLSADWAGLMIHEAEQAGKIDFCLFSAGAVGSHGPVKYSKNQEEEASYMSKSIAGLVTTAFDSIPTDTVSLLHMIHLPLHLREPNLRVSENFVVRPWLFKKLFGDEKLFVNTLQLGSVFIAGMPCDFSGELMNEIDSAAVEQNLHCAITSFNGGYMGYVTDSKWYGLNTYETRTMGWFGNNNGEYLSEVVMRILKK